MSCFTKRKIALTCSSAKCNIFIASTSLALSFNRLIAFSLVLTTSPTSTGSYKDTTFIAQDQCPLKNRIAPVPLVLVRATAVGAAAPAARWVVMAVVVEPTSAPFLRSPGDHAILISSLQAYPMVAVKLEPIPETR